jgi:replicative DNA helicase
MARVNRADYNRLPHSEEAEQAVIGSIIIDPDATYRVMETGLTPAHFFNQQLGWVYEAAQTLTLKRSPIDITILGNRLESVVDHNGRNRLELIGGMGQLAALISAPSSSVHAAHYARIVVDTARRRNLLSATAVIAEMAGSHDGDIDELMASASRVFLPAVSVEGQRSHVYGTENTLLGYLTLQQERAERLNRDPEALLITGFPDLDNILGDLLPGYLHVIVARSSVGKTMYMECAAETNAKRGKKVAFYHLELGHEMMLDRMMARHAQVPIRELRRGEGTDAVAQAVDSIIPWFQNMTFIHCPGWSAERIAADIQRLTARGECDLAIIDYLQKIALPSGRMGLNAAMLYGLMAETLKTAAETCEVPIILGSQVSRDFKGREDRRPHMEDIRNSGEIEEKANQIVILHRPEERNERARMGDVERLEVTVEKNTGGGIGQVELAHVIGRYLLSSIHHEGGRPL